MSLKLPWTLVSYTDPGCVKHSSDSVTGKEIRNVEGEVIFSSGHETYHFDEFDLRMIIAAVNKYVNEVGVEQGSKRR
jgi:hypothetical protein